MFKTLKSKATNHLNENVYFTKEKLVFQLVGIFLLGGIVTLLIVFFSLFSFISSSTRDIVSGAGSNIQYKPGNTNFVYNTSSVTSVSKFFNLKYRDSNRLPEIQFVTTYNTDYSQYEDYKILLDNGKYISIRFNLIDQSKVITGFKLDSNVFGNKISDLPNTKYVIIAQPLGDTIAFPHETLAKVYKGNISVSNCVNSQKEVNTSFQINGFSSKFTSDEINLIANIMNNLTC